MGEPVLSRTKDHITRVAVAGSSVREVPANSVAVVVRSGILERRLPVALVPFVTTLNQDMKAVVAHDGIDPRWIAYGLRAYEGDLLRQTRKAGTTVASIEMPRFFASTLPVPDIAEQRRIVELLEDHLSRLDAGAEELSRCRLRLEALWAATLSKARTGPELALPQVADVQGGIQKQPRRAPRVNHYPFLRVANVTSSGLDLADVHRIELFGDELARLRLKPGDLLVVEGNGSASQIGRAALWDGSVEDCVHQNHLIRVRPHDAMMPDYLEAVWNSPEHRRKLMAVASSSSGLHTLSVSKLKRLTLPVPSLAEQRVVMDRVAEVRSSHRRLEAAVVMASARCQSLRRAILAAAFDGKLTGRHCDQKLIEELDRA